jgi:hypothetical protein
MWARKGESRMAPVPFKRVRREVIMVLFSI